MKPNEGTTMKKLLDPPIVREITKVQIAEAWHLGSFQSIWAAKPPM
jgi:hypothetical protein